MDLDKFKIQEIFKKTILQKTDSLFENYFETLDSNCFILLTEELLNQLDEIFDKSQLKETYSYAVGEFIYADIYGDNLFPLKDIEKMKLGELVEKGENIIYISGFDYDDEMNFYTLKSIKKIITNDFFEDFENVITNDFFEKIFIYSTLKVLNK